MVQLDDGRWLAIDLHGEFVMLELDSFETNVGKTRDFQHGSALHKRSVKIG